ncbi:hypothetical protein [Eggerthia catenaformis]|uniref:hypothetical protein n=1 Tax=Eggerthia catenaformis TaxID=31973 RepID=UPI003C6F5931
MKKLLLCFFLLLATGCTVNEKKEKIDWELGVIETSIYKRNTRLVYFDGDFNIKGEDKIKAAGVSRHLKDSSYQKENAYFEARGLTRKNDDKKIIELNRSTRNIKFYDVDRINIQGVIANDKYTYTISNLDKKVYITQTDYNNKKVKEISFNDIITLNLFLAGDKIIVPYNLIENSEKEFINIYDRQLNLIKKIDLSQYGRSITEAVVINDKIYLPVSNKTNEDGSEETGNNLIVELDVKSLDFKIIKIKTKELGHVNKYGDWLIIMNSESPTYEGRKMTFYNTKTGEEKIFNLKHPLRDVEVYGDFIYSANYYEENKERGYILVKYSIKDNMKEVRYKKVNLLNKYKEYHYYSDIFVNYNN